MTVEIAPDFPHFGAWLNQLTAPRAAPDPSPQPAQNPWPTWRAGGAPFTALHMLTARRHQGLVDTADPGVTLWNPYPFNGFRWEGWTPPPGPSDELTYWLLEPAANGAQQYVAVEYTHDDPGSPTTTTATPDASHAYVLAHLTDIRNYVGAVQPPSPDVNAVGGFHIINDLALIKPPSEPSSSAWQSSQVAYLLEVPSGSADSGFLGGRSPFTWDGVNWTADLYTHDFMGIRDGWLHTAEVDPATGALVDVTAIPECRRRHGLLTDGEYPAFYAMHGPLGYRAVWGLTHYGTLTRLIWRYAPAWQYMAVAWAGDFTTVNSTNGYIPHIFDGGAYYRGVDFAAENADIEATMLGTPTGAWHILAETARGVGVEEVWSPATIISAPPAGAAIIYMGGQDYQDPENPSTHVYIPNGEFDLWPEAASLPLLLPILGGGALAGGTP